ncbi:HD domain-containing protein [Sulfurimonas lithotrophica]|uniref:HD domain-containing protein n=1 Tax=Sulfurimonas lithotrophica TaxID=2590022 RepID=A0A5P8NZK1_9BACT|nr:HD domain-containing protein [Sulfurimonas lithotrophica]
MKSGLKPSNIISTKVRLFLYLSSLSTMIFSQNYCINVCPFIDELSYNTLTFNLFIIFIFHIMIRELLYYFFDKTPSGLTLPRFLYYLSIISWMIAGIGAFLLHNYLYPYFPIGSHLKLLSSYWVLGAGLLAQLEYIIFEQRYKQIVDVLYIKEFNENISRRIFESFLILSAAPSITIILILARYRNETLQGSHILEEIAYVIVLFISVAIICAYYFGKMLKEDTKKVLENIHEIKHSNYNITHNIARADEIGEISQAIESMAHEIGNLNQEIVSTQTEIVNTMGEIAETRSKETGNHVKRVALYSELLALKYGMDANEAKLLKQASPMHDIGKIGIPDSILNKPGRHTKEEFEIMKTHANLGYDILKNSSREILKAAAIVAYEHHEKYDGSGYPRGLSGKDIHIYGRITAVADVFDALGSDRVYKKAWDDDKIFELFKEESGKHFDPRLVKLFFENIDEILKIRNSLKDSI